MHARSLTAPRKQSAPKIGQDEGLDDLGEQDHGRPEARSNGLQKKGIAIDDLQDPVRAAHEAREAQRKHVVRRELLHHLLLSNT